jgi:hypothetical protein
MPVVSVHIADVGPRRGLGLLLKRYRPGSIAGLRHANVGNAGVLSASVLPKVMPGRIGLVAFWDDAASLDRFVQEHPIAQRLSSGWHARLEPLRRFGSWPGLADEIPVSRHTDYDGPAVVLTLGRLRLTQAPRFLRTSAKAEAAVVDAPGSIWATGIARPPFVATCSLWESSRALATYAYGNSDRRHPDAIDVDVAKPFHHQSAFVRFRPYHVQGGLTGRNPLEEHALVSQS